MLYESFLCRKWAKRTSVTAADNLTQTVNTINTSEIEKKAGEFDTNWKAISDKCGGCFPKITLKSTVSEMGKKLEDVKKCINGITSAKDKINSAPDEIDLVKGKVTKQIDLVQYLVLDLPNHRRPVQSYKHNQTHREHLGYHQEVLEHIHHRPYRRLRLLRFRLHRVTTRAICPRFPSQPGTQHNN